MATKRMLIDAAHPEETRVVVLDGNRLEDFDVEVASRRQLKGNIYLAKVTRVEPSLQAAFVDYGGNRHGFLAFSEIHPDYYQIPVADREALIAEQESAVRDDDDESPGDADEDSVETLGGDDAEEMETRPPLISHRNYKIQEVIKRRQILLVQVVKEERGTKGAALTTYLSLAGRYCVLMPNTARGGGISRKITNASDRKRLRSIVTDMEIPDGMAVIVRTAGSERSKAEIKRDYDYLLRLWDSVRELTLESTAPALVYEEGNLIKRSIRDLYGRDIDEILVEGEDGYRTAKDFMKLLIPSHAKRVKRYEEDSVPLVQKFRVEGQLDAMHSPEVQLRSGGYIVLNPTEALVAIDVNSGRATRERNIEETAVKTNLEAAEEVARQLRLRDLSGLIVIDFIDMETQRNQTQVERRLKDAMRNDRARIQLGRISPFGLLELSRQRLRPSIIETSSEPCPHCGGTGIRRSIESTALHMLRVIEEEGIRGRSARTAVHVPTSVALYILNQKRAALAEIENRYDFSVTLEADDSLIPPDHRIERLVTRKASEPEGEEETEEAAGEGDREETAKRKRRRRPRRRKRSDETRPSAAEAAEVEDTGETEEAGEEAEVAEEDQTAADAEGETATKRRRRGKRGGRRRTRKTADADAAPDTEGEAVADEAGAEQPPDAEAELPLEDTTPAAEPMAVPSAENLLEAPAVDGLLESAVEESVEPEAKARPKRSSRRAATGRGRKRAANEPDAAEPQETAPDIIYVPPSEVEEGGAQADEDVAAAPPPPAAQMEDEGAGLEAYGEMGPVADTEAETSDDAAAASRTTVIQVGSEDAEKEQPRRRGWWQRFGD